MNTFLFFSNNQDKIIEINEMFKSTNINILTLNDLPKVNEPKETGCSFETNAKIKSLYGFKKFGVPCFADDSGICIKALKNLPGTNSKRFLNSFKNKQNAFSHIIEKTKISKNKDAFFITSICLTLGIGHYVFFNGKVNGKISNRVRGSGGFGYDPIFIPNNYKKTFSEITLNIKNKISHRSLAINKLVNFLIN